MIDGRSERSRAIGRCLAAAAVEVSNMSVILKPHVTGFRTVGEMGGVTAAARVAVGEWEWE